MRKINKEIENDWLIFLKYAGRYHIVKDKPYPNDYREDFIPEHFDFLKKHFTPIWYEITTNDKGQKVAKETCFYNTAEKSCKYRLIAPLKIKGKVNIRAGSPIGEGCGDVPFDTEIGYEDYSFWIYMPYVHLQIKPNERNQKVVGENIPKWMLDGFGGEVSYEVEFEVANMSGYIGDFSSSVKDIALTVDKSACGYPSYIVADNIKFIKNLAKKKIQNRRAVF